MACHAGRPKGRTCEKSIPALAGHSGVAVMHPCMQLNLTLMYCHGLLHVHLSHLWYCASVALEPKVLLGGLIYVVSRP
jgi:hypothetical protein